MNFGNDNYQDHFGQSIRHDGAFYTTVKSGSLSNDKSKLAPYLLKYDLKGELKSKYHFKDFFTPNILGIYDDKIYFSGGSENICRG